MPIREMNKLRLMTQSHAYKLSNRFVLIFLMCLTLGLGACEALPRSEPQLVVEPNRVDLRLAEAADRATKAMETLAEVEQAKNPVPLAQRLDDVPPELRRTVTITWVGPVEPITKRMAERAGYRFTTLGSAPAVPIIVRIDVVNHPIIDVLRDIGLQMNGRGSVVLDGENRVVEVNYASSEF